MKFWPFRRKPRAAELVPAVFATYYQAAPARKQARSRRRGMTGLALLCFFYGFAFALLPTSLFYIIYAPLLGALLLFVVVLLPLHDFPPPKAFVWAFWAFWLTMYLWPNYLAVALPGLPWITVNRLFGGPLAVMLLMAASSSRPFQQECSETLKAIPNLSKCVIGMAIVQIISTAFSDHLLDTFNRVLNLQLVWTVPFFACAYLFRKEGRMELWAKLFVIMAIVVGLICIQETRLQHVVWAYSIPSFLKVGDDSVNRVLYNAHMRGSDYRVIGTTMSPLSLAEFLALTSPFVLYFLVNARTLRQIALLVAADVLIVMTTLHTQSRLGLVGLLISHSLYGLFIGINRWRASPHSMIGPMLTLAYPAILGAVGFAVLTVGRIRVAVLGGGLHQASNDAREMQFALAGPALLKSPIFGFGAGEGASRLGYTNPAGQETIDSYILSIALDYGIVGFILFYGMIIGAIVTSAKLAIKSRSDADLSVPVTLCLLVFLSIKPVLSQESNNPVLYMLVAMVGVLAWKAGLSRSGVKPQVLQHPHSFADGDQRLGQA